MWWSRPHPPRTPSGGRGRPRRLVLGLALLGLAGCGFRPLYGEHSTGADPAVARHLAAIDVTLIDDRFGQVLRQRLRDRLAPNGATGEAYTLDVSYDRSLEELAFRKDETATLARLSFGATYVLRSGDAVLTRGSSRGQSSYDLLQARYATVVAERDAEERIARQLADDIATRLGLYFAGRAGDGR